MPKKTESLITEKKIVLSAPTMLKTKKINAYLSKAFNLLKKLSSTQLLVFLLIIASFLIGVLVTKVQYLEKGQTQNNQAAIPSAQQPAQQQGLADGQKVNIDNGKLPVQGNKDAKVTIVEYSDFECPFCEKFFTETYGQIKKDYIDTGKIAFYFRHFPLDFHPAAKPTAIASECANEQGQFWAYHDIVFKNQAQIASKTAEEINSALKSFGATLGLNTAQFNSCLDQEKYKTNVDEDTQSGVSAGVNGTPTLFINGTAVIGAQPYAAFKAIIDQELAK